MQCVTGYCKKKNPGSASGQDSYVTIMVKNKYNTVDMKINRPASQ